jgi:GxxExxY protein
LAAANKITSSLDKTIRAYLRNLRAQDPTSLFFGCVSDSPADVADRRRLILPFGSLAMHALLATQSLTKEISMNNMFPLKEETYRILGACFEVYNEKGYGFTEPVYQECLEFELDLQSIPSHSQPRIGLVYKGRPLKKAFEPDFICFEKIIVELKAVSDLADEHRSQVLNYLNATGHEVALLINFGHFPKLEYERIVNTRAKNPRPSAICGQNTGLPSSAPG